MKISLTHLSVFLLFVIILSCSKSISNDNNETVKDKTAVSAAETNNVLTVSKAQFESENMQLVSFQEVLFPDQVITSGMIDVPPNSKAVISSYTGGYIKQTSLLIGDNVKKGEPLVIIENPDFLQLQQDYLEVTEQLTYLNAEYNRQKELYAEKIASEKSFLKAESDFKRTNAVYNGLHKKLQMLHMDPDAVKQGRLSSTVIIYAPISGSVTAVYVNTGAYVSPADKIMEIVNTDHIHLELKVYEKDVLKLKEGQKVVFSIPESSNKIYEGDIHLIGKSIDENRTVQVHAHIDEGLQHNFIVGMFVEAKIVIEENMFKALPESSFVVVDKKDYVLFLRSKDSAGYTFVKKEILKGRTYNGFSQILNSSAFKNTDEFLVESFNLVSEE